MPSAERSGVFSSAPRVEECSTLDKTLRSSLSLSSQPTNQSGGGAGLPTAVFPIGLWLWGGLGFSFFHLIFVMVKLNFINQKACLIN